MTESFANVFECYEAIGKWLTEEAPEPWESIIADFEIIQIDDVSREVIQYIPTKAPGKLKSFCIDDMGYADCFFQLAKLSSTPEKGLFKTCQFKLQKNGSYHVEFGY